METNIICERSSIARHADSLTVRVHTQINMHKIRWCGPTTLPYAVWIRVIVKVMSLHRRQYDCQHMFVYYFLAIVIGGSSYNQV